MLLRVGAAMMLSTVALGLVVAVVVALSCPAGEESASRQAASVEPASSGVAERWKREFDPGEKLEIDDEEPAEPKKSPRPRQESEDRPLPVPFQD